MINIRIIFIVLTLIILTKSIQGQEKIVDQFKIKNNKVEVTFYDPISELYKSSDFQEKTEIEKSDSLNFYLHNNPLYLFKVADKRTKDIIFFCIRGNPEKRNTKMFYKVEVIKGISDTKFNPKSDSYLDKIDTVIYNVNCGGTLFENMNYFSKPENKKLIGNGIKFLGYYRRVQPYSEIKVSLIAIIENYIK